jgi:hypothetical protein
MRRWGTLYLAVCVLLLASLAMGVAHHVLAIRTTKAIARAAQARAAAMTVPQAPQVPSPASSAPNSLLDGLSIASLLTGLAGLLLWVRSLFKHESGPWLIPFALSAACIALWLLQV